MGPLLGVGNEDIPENSATMTLAETMVKAWELYSSKRLLLYCPVMLLLTRWLTPALHHQVSRGVSRGETGVQLCGPAITSIRHPPSQLQRQSYQGDIRGSRRKYVIGQKPAPLRVSSFFSRVFCD